jgi:hypothetical protein
LDDLTAKLPEWEREAQEHERKARALRQIIEGVRALNGDAARLFGVQVATQRASSTPVVPADVPRGRAAVRRIAAERPGVWKVSEMKAEIIARGWGDPGTGTEAAMKRLAASGEAEKIGHGTYRFGPINGSNELIPATEAGESSC